ncbi:MAG: phosphoglycerate dehydrogenase [Clostridiales bacterium]|nr:phosphoglycerate dehydrogenase [Clostridiales bacterium]MCF8021523.1 phosphoglycerate dehydrogenase [Clostridiales bacterium]
MSEFKVLVMDGVSEKGLTPFLKEENIEVVMGSKMNEDELIEIIGDYDAIIVRSATKVNSRVLKSAVKLKVVGRAGVGVDNIDLDACTEKGVLVVNAPDGNTMAATEHTMAMMLSLARNIPQAVNSLKQGVWNKKAFLGVELRGKILGVIGFGRIGSAVARRAQSMEMEIITYDPYITEEKAAATGVSIVSYEELLKRSDFITIHMPKTEETYHLIDEKALSQVKNNVRIINCARGGLIDEEALFKALESDLIAGAALDVFENEPNTESPLHKIDKVIATPHLGASTTEAQLNVAVDVAEEIISALHGEVVKNTVNVPSIPPEVISNIQPYLKLAEKLGKLEAQLVEGRINKIEITYSGDFAQQNVKPVTTAIVKGVLDPILQERVNFVNALALAKNRGIQVTQTVNGDTNGYTSMIDINVISDKAEKSVAGTFLRDNDPRIVMVDGYRIDAIPSGYIIYVSHYDKPRIIGPVGTLIGDNNVNIATMQVGREKSGGKAVMILTVDAKVSQETLEQIKSLNGIIDVKFVSL